MSIIEGSYPTTDAEWKAQDDARTLAQANVIKSDAGRLEKAQAQAAKMADREREEANALSRVAGRKKSSSNRESNPDKGSVVTKVKNHNVFNRIK